MNMELILGITMAAFLVIVIVLFTWARRQKREADSLKEELRELNYKYEYDMHKAEILSLQSQINPHFLYNTLEVIRGEAFLNDDLKSAELAESLANYFRYNISRRSDVVSLGEELDNVDNYIRIQKMRFGERINYEVFFQTEKEEARGAQIPKLSLQPLVENSIYHGLEKKARGGKVAVYITVTEKRLLIQVSDNGQGMDKGTLERLRRHIAADVAIPKETDRHGGIALMNVNKRIKMLYGQEYGLEFSSREGFGTTAEITMPFIAG